jgi:hypothetical protein
MLTGSKPFLYSKRFEFPVEASEDSEESEEPEAILFEI